MFFSFSFFFCCMARILKTFDVPSAKSDDHADKFSANRFPPTRLGATPDLFKLVTPASRRLNVKRRRRRCDAGDALELVPPPFGFRKWATCYLLTFHLFRRKPCFLPTYRQMKNYKLPVQKWHWSMETLKGLSWCLCAWVGRGEGRLEGGALVLCLLKKFLWRSQTWAAAPVVKRDSQWGSGGNVATQVWAPLDVAKLVARRF